MECIRAPTWTPPWTFQSALSVFFVSEKVHFVADIWMTLVICQQVGLANPSFYDTLTKVIGLMGKRFDSIPMLQKKWNLKSQVSKLFPFTKSDTKSTQIYHASSKGSWVSLIYKHIDGLLFLNDSVNRDYLLVNEHMTHFSQNMKSVSSWFNAAEYKWSKLSTLTLSTSRVIVQTVPDIFVDRVSR